MTVYYKSKQIVLPMKYLFFYLNIMRSIITGLRRIITYTLSALFYRI